MSEVRDDELIRELARDLRPVRPIPRIRTAALGVVVLWLAVAAGVLGALGRELQGLSPALGVRIVFGGLLTCGLGGVLGALALGVPGRERLARIGLALGLGGMAVAAGVGTALFVRSPAGTAHPPLAADLGCLAVACGVGLLTALGVALFGSRAVPHRPLLLALAGAAGAAGLGAVAAQASCPYADFHHLLMGHVLAPAMGVLLLTLPLLVALRRMQR